MTTPIQAFILAESDRDALEEGRRQASWRAGWQACERRAAERYEEGFTDGFGALKRLQHDLVSEIRSEERMWGPGGRAHYADPRPGDYAGGPVAPW